MGLSDSLLPSGGFEVKDPDWASVFASSSRNHNSLRASLRCQTRDIAVLVDILHLPKHFGTESVHILTGHQSSLLLILLVLLIRRDLFHSRVV